MEPIVDGIAPDPILGKWVWKAACPYCEGVFGGYEFDHTDPIKRHADTCDKRPDNEDDNSYLER